MICRVWSKTLNILLYLYSYIYAIASTCTTPRGFFSHCRKNRKKLLNALCNKIHVKFKDLIFFTRKKRIKKTRVLNNTTSTHQIQLTFSNNVLSYGFSNLDKALFYPVDNERCLRIFGRNHEEFWRKWLFLSLIHFSLKKRLDLCPHSVYI